MTNKVNNTQAPATQGPASAAKTAAKPNPVAQMQATERVFDQAFINAPPASDFGQNDSPFGDTSTSQDQLALLSPLASLIGQPNGKPGDAFALPTGGAAGFTDDDLQNALTQARGQKLPPALGHLSDAMAARQLSTVTARLGQAASALQSVKLKPQVIAQIRAQVVAPLSKQIRQQLGLPAEVDDDDQTDPTSSGTNASGTTVGQVYQPNVSQLTQTISQLQSQPSTAGMDIDALVEMVITQCGQGSELDLRDIATSLQQNLDMSKALRGLKEQQSTDAASIKSQVDNEYFTLTSVQPPATQPLIDPSKCSQAQYEAWRGVSVTAPLIDDSVDPPKITYTPPTLCDPNPINDIDIPQAFKPGVSADDTTAVTTAQAAVATATTAQQNAQADLQKLLPTGAGITVANGQVIVVGGVQLPGTSPPDPQTLQAAEAALVTASASLDTANTNLTNAQATVASDGPTPSSNNGAGAQFADPTTGAATTTTTSDLTQWQQNTQDQLDDQSDMNQDLQLRMQMAQQAYTQCMQAVSNIMKTDSDTKNSIIKNLSN